MRVPRTPRSGTVRHLDHIWSCLYKHGDSALRPALYAPLSSSRSLWLELATYLTPRFLLIAFRVGGREASAKREASVRRDAAIKREAAARQFAREGRTRGAERCTQR